MTVLNILARLAFRKLANDPVIQKKVAKVIEKEVVPLAKKGLKHAKPKIKEAKASLTELGSKLQDKINK